MEDLEKEKEISSKSTITITLTKYVDSTINIKTELEGEMSRLEMLGLLNMVVVKHSD